MRLCSTLFLLVSLTLPVSAEAFEWFPGSTYNNQIPTPESLLGHAIGSYYTEHSEMLAYMRKLETVSNRVRVFSVGRSNERREILLVAVSSPENLLRLEEIRLAIKRLADPRVTSEEQAGAIASETPAICWMNFANDGNESAAFEAAIQLAYQLAAAEDPVTQEILRETVTLIYPSHNPESHSRHVAWMKASATGNPNPDAQEHRGDWRMDNNNNHYQIDLNRDAVFLSQVESRIIVREIHRWNPVVFVDHHGNPDRFFFPPWAQPVNTQLDQKARDWVQAYGRDIAAAFDRRAWTYFTRNVYDLHYPGYYDSYPTLNGATGMTFETDGGGSKGLAYRLPDNRVTTLRDGVLHHFTGSMSTLMTTARHRRQRLLDLYDFRAAAMREAAAEPVKQFLLVPGQNPGPATDLVTLLLQHQIEVDELQESFGSQKAHGYFSEEAGEVNFAPGTFLVATAQPQKRLLRVLLDRDSPLEEDFLKKVAARKDYNDRVNEPDARKRLGFYDVTAWSLPLAYGVDAYWTEDVFRGRRRRVEEPLNPAQPTPPEAGFAYLFPWGERSSVRAAAELWEGGHVLSMAREGFRLEGKDHPPGTVVVRLQANPADTHQRIAELVSRYGLRVSVASTARVESGWDLGDRSVVDLEPPRIAVVSEEPTRSTAFGAIWYMLEVMYEIPFTAIKAADLGSSDLNHFNVIVLPDGSAAGYERILGGSTLERLLNWIREGGTLVCLKGAASWAARKETGLTGAVEMSDVEEGNQEDGDESKPGRKLETVPGALVRASVDREHFLGLAVSEQITPLIRSDTVFRSPEVGAVVVRLHPDRPVVSGFAFAESAKALRNAPFMWHEKKGRGRVVCFADDPTFRTFLHGSHGAFLNALLLSPTSRW